MKYVVWTLICLPILSFLGYVLHRFRKLEIEEKELEAKNEGLKARLDAETKTPNQRRALINELSDSIRK